MHAPQIQQSYRTSHLTKGPDYHETFSKSISRAVMWDLEKSVLESLMRSLFSAPPTLLDFATGTGRIAAHLEAHCSASVAVDVSSSMLNVARENVRRTELILSDITKEEPLPGRKFDLITAFRFFPNAELELRAAVISRLSQYLDRSGFLVFNNHKNDTSLMLKVARLVGRGDKHNMSHREVEELVTSAGLRIRWTIPIGYFNWTDVWTLRPKAAAVAVEKLLMKVPSLRPLAQNVIYVCSY